MATLRHRIVCGSLAAAAVATLGANVVRGQPADPAYEVYAIRYAIAPGFAASSLVAGADPARTIDIPFMIWVLKGPDDRNVLVDAGYFSRSNIRLYLTMKDRSTRSGRSDGSYRS